MTAFEQKPIAYVEWNDAALVTGGWHDEDDCIAEAHELATSPIRSAGFLIAQDDECITLGLSRNANNGDAAGVFVIPRSAITKLELLAFSGLAETSS